MIIYIHGFGSSGEGSKAKLFREYFKAKGEAFIAPSLSYVPELAIQTLEELIKSYEGKVMLIGSSLGGFYSLYLSQKYKLYTVLINPAIYPYITLNRCLGYAPNFYDESSFLWSSSHINMLEKYKVEEVKNKYILLLVQKGDETLDYKEAVNKCQGSQMIVEEAGSHSFDDIGRHYLTIEKHLKQ